MSKHTGPGAFLKNFIERNYGERALHHHMQRRLELYETPAPPVPLPPFEKVALSGPEFEFDED